MVLERFSLNGQAAVVTGAGRGIGAASALALAEAGADVVISARTEPQLARVAEQVAALGRRAVTVAADLSKLDVIASLASTAVDAFGRLDVVVNNLGGAMPLPFLDTSPEFLEDAFRFNVATAHALNLAAVPYMLKGDGGAIVNVASSMGRMTGRGYLAYGTVKAALIHYTQLAAKDLAPRVRVNAVAVGSTATSALDIVLTDETLRHEMEAATPLHHIADPEEIALAVLYLASPASSFLTGKVLEPDGGTDAPTLDFRLPDL